MICPEYYPNRFIPVLPTNPVDGCYALPDANQEELPFSIEELIIPILQRLSTASTRSLSDIDPHLFDHFRRPLIIINDEDTYSMHPSNSPQDPDDEVKENLTSSDHSPQSPALEPL